MLIFCFFNDNQHNNLRDDNRDDGSTMNEFLNSRNVCDPAWVPIQMYTSEEDRVSLGGSEFDTIFNEKNYMKNDMKSGTKNDVKNDATNDTLLESNTYNNSNRKFGTSNSTSTNTSSNTGTGTPVGVNNNMNYSTGMSLPPSPIGSNISNISNFGDKLKFTSVSDKEKEREKNTNNMTSSMNSYENIWDMNEIQEESLDTEKSMIRSKSISTIQEISKDDHYVTDDARTYIPTESRRAVSQLILPLRDRALSEMHTNTPRMHALIVEVSNLHRTGNTFAILMLLYCAVV